LASLDIKVNSVTDAGLGLTIPAFRVDVQRELMSLRNPRVYGLQQHQFYEEA